MTWNLNSWLWRNLEPSSPLLHCDITMVSNEVETNSMTGNIEGQLARARALIEAQRYDEARAVLITIDHPTADKWLARLNDMQSTVTAPPESFTMKLILSVLLLLVFVVPGLIALSVFSREAKEAQGRSRQPIPGASALIALNRYTFAIIAVGLILLILFVAIAAINPGGRPIL